jgi:hypothetical protein
MMKSLGVTFDNDGKPGRGYTWSVQEAVSFKLGQLEIQRGSAKRSSKSSKGTSRKTATAKPPEGEAQAADGEDNSTSYAVGDWVLATYHDGETIFGIVHAMDETTLSVQTSRGFLLDNVFAEIKPSAPTMYLQSIISASEADGLTRQEITDEHVRLERKRDRMSYDVLAELEKQVAGIAQWKKTQRAMKSLGVEEESPSTDAISVPYPSEDSEIPETADRLSGESLEVAPPRAPEAEPLPTEAAPAQVDDDGIAYVDPETGEVTLGDMMDDFLGPPDELREENKRFRVRDLDTLRWFVGRIRRLQREIEVAKLEAADYKRQADRIERNNTTKIDGLIEFYAPGLKGTVRAEIEASRIKGKTLALPEGEISGHVTGGVEIDKPKLIEWWQSLDDIMRDCVPIVEEIEVIEKKKIVVNEGALIALWKDGTLRELGLEPRGIHEEVKDEYGEIRIGKSREVKARKKDTPQSDGSDELEDAGNDSRV